VQGGQGCKRDYILNGGAEVQRIKEDDFLIIVTSPILYTSGPPFFKSLYYLSLLRILFSVTSGNSLTSQSGTRRTMVIPRKVKTGPASGTIV
jgi:hypothetical protein